MKFWIRINGRQEGPMEIEQMKEFNITPTTYVWCAGMKDWAYARDVEDLKEVLLQSENVNTPEPAEPTIEENNDVEPSVEIANEVAKSIEENNNEAQDEVVDDVEIIEAEQEETTIQPEKPAEEVETKLELPPCPPTNLVWAVITTVLCCQVTGIISIILAAQVTSKYNCGDYETAKKYSNWSAWLVIASIILSILWSSLAFPFMLIGEMIP